MTLFRQLQLIAMFLIFIRVGVLCNKGDLDQIQQSLYKVLQDY